MTAASVAASAPGRPRRVRRARRTEISVPLSSPTHVCFVPGHCAWKCEFTNIRTEARLSTSSCPSTQNRQWARGSCSPSVGRGAAVTVSWPRAPRGGGGARPLARSRNLVLGLLGARGDSATVPAAGVSPGGRVLRRRPLQGRSRGPAALLHRSSLLRTGPHGVSAGHALAAFTQTGLPLKSLLWSPTRAQSGRTQRTVPGRPHPLLPVCGGKAAAGHGLNRTGPVRAGCFPDARTARCLQLVPRADGPCSSSSPHRGAGRPWGLGANPRGR